VRPAPPDAEHLTPAVLDPTPVINNATSSFFGLVPAVVKTIEQTLVAPAPPTSIPEVVEIMLEDTANWRTEEMLSLGVPMYAKFFGLTNIQNPDTHYAVIRPWLRACTDAWKKVMGRNFKVRSLPGDTSVLTALLQAIPDYPHDEPRGAVGFESLRIHQVPCPVDEEGAVPGSLNLIGHVFVDWYMTFCYYNYKHTTCDVSDFPFIGEEHKSVMAKVLLKNPSLYALYHDEVTGSHFTFNRLIQAGMCEPSLRVGCAAGDEESYHMFRDFFVAMVRELHMIAPREPRVSEPDVGLPVPTVPGVAPKIKIYTDTSLRHLTNTDVKYITGFEELQQPAAQVGFVSFKCSRNLRGLSMPIHASRAGRRKAEEIIVASLEKLQGAFAGKYHFLFENLGTRYDAKPSEGTLLAAAGGTRDWPFGRGLFSSNDGTLSVLVNYEDHLCIEVAERGSDVIGVFTKYLAALEAIKSALWETAEVTYMHDNVLGFYTSCPSKLGTGLEASMSVRLEHLGEYIHRVYHFLFFDAKHITHAY